MEHIRQSALLSVIPAFIDEAQNVRYQRSGEALLLQSLIFQTGIGTMHELPVTHGARQQIAFNTGITFSKAFLQSLKSRLDRFLIESQRMPLKKMYFS